MTTNAVYMMTDTIYNGVRVGDIDVGGLSTLQAESEINAVMKKRTKQAVLVYVCLKIQKWFKI